MQDEAVFLQEMHERPEDTSLRLVFADWLEERGDPRGELLRLLHTLTQWVDVPRRQELEDRLRSLVSAGVSYVGPFFTNSIGMKFAWIPSGTFMMGSPENEEGRGHYRSADETQHLVTLTKGYYLGVHAVPQACWQEIMGENPSEFRHDDHPVEQISWDDCQEFLRRLSERDSNAYRLPTEAEWEYACRAGTTSPYYFGEAISDQQAKFLGEQTSAVGSYPANAWGLHEMHGNVWEWCADWSGDYPRGSVTDPQGAQSGEYRVLRGGSFGTYPKFIRSAYRNGGHPDFHSNYSLRVVRCCPTIT